MFIADLDSEIDDIKSAAENGKLVIFLGAGIGAQVDLPDWKEFNQELISKHQPKSKTSPELIEEFKNELRAEKDYYKVFHKIFKEDQRTYARMIKHLWECPHANLERFRLIVRSILKLGKFSIATTNIDSLIIDSGLFRSHQYNYRERCFSQDISKEKVFFVHGVNEKAVFTSTDREELYNIEEFRSFLYNLFGSYHVLFVGCSFDDRPLLNHARLPSFQTSDEKFYHWALFAEDTDKDKLETLKDYGVRAIWI